MLNPIRVRGLTLEHFLSYSVFPFGPLIAIGEPHEKLPPLGASRAYYGDLEWQDAVRGLMQEARFVIVMVHHTPNLLWEIKTLADSAMLDKTILVLPPVRRRELKKRWLGFVTYLSIDKMQSLLQLMDPRRILLVRFMTCGQVRVYGANSRDIWAYDACLTAALDPETPLASLSDRKTSP
jgi:hypothetical protein